MKLTGEQIDFIKEYFFKREDLACWESIVDKLLKDGSCIVAGTGKLWYGGVGNFIQRTPAENAVDCSLLTFQREEFLASEYFRSHLEFFIEDNLNQILVLQDKHRAISRLINKEK